MNLCEAPMKNDVPAMVWLNAKIASKNHTLARTGIHTLRRSMKPRLDSTERSTLPTDSPAWMGVEGDPGVLPFSDRVSTTLTRREPQWGAAARSIRTLWLLLSPT